MTARTRVPGVFRIDAIREGQTVRVHSVDRVEIALDLGFGVALSRIFEFDGFVRVKPAQRAQAVHCLVVLLGGKRVIVQPESDKPSCSGGGVYLNEAIHGTPIGLVTNLDFLDRPILDVAPFFGYLGSHGFDVSKVYSVVNNKRST